jgi:hypothetical protein
VSSGWDCFWEELLLGKIASGKSLKSGVASGKFPEVVTEVVSEEFSEEVSEAPAGR